MEMDPVKQNYQIPLFEPSSSLFKLDLINQDKVELYIPDLIPLDRISEKIRIKMHQELDLNGDFELFEKKEKKKLRSSQTVKSFPMRAKNFKQGDLASASLEKKSSVASLRLKRTGKKLFRTALSKHQLGQNSSLNKRERNSITTEASEHYNFPSLASILGGDEESSVDENEFSLGGFRLNTIKAETEEKSESIFQFDLFDKKISHHDFLLEKNATFEKTVEPFSCDALLFSKLFTETNQFQNKRAWNKKVKENPRMIDNSFQSYKMFNISGNKKIGSFDLALEKEGVPNSFSVPLEIQLEENVALGLSSNVVLTK